jgi:predicted DCC family thiol-disulfide oxidoreductase YuxK
MAEPDRPDPYQQRLTVLYDGACPLCSREIAWYRHREASDSIDWLDLSRCDDTALPDGISRTEALARFHVVDGLGRTVTGAAAFARLWACYPGLRRIAGLARLPGIAQVLELGYRAFLPLRPSLARLIPPAKTADGD